MRKLFNTILALAAGIGLFVSCQEKVEDLNFATVLNVDKDAVELTAAGDQVQLQLTANGDWIAVAPDWLRVEPGSGSGNAVITVFAPANENEFQEMMGPRDQKLYIYGEGVKVEIPIIQAGLPALDASRTFTKITSAAEFEPGKAYILVYEIKGEDNTITRKLTKASSTGLDDNKYSFLFVADVTESEEGVIDLSDGSNSFKIAASGEGYTLQQGRNGGYLYQSGSYANFYTTASVDNAHIWSMEFQEDGTVKFTNISNNDKVMHYSANYGNVEARTGASAPFPFLYKDKAAPTDEILNVEDLTVEADATSASIPVTANKEWSVRNHDEWITSFAKNEAGDAIEVTFGVNTSNTAERKATFTVIGETTNKVITLTQKAAATVITAADKTVAVGRTVQAEVECNTDGELSFVSKNTAIATVNAQGIITGVAEGETTITVTVEETDLYPEASTSFKVTVTASAGIATNVAGISEQIPDTATGSASAVNYEAELTGAVVSYVNGNNAYIEDQSGAILLYMSGHGLAAGDVISGKVSGKGYKYNGLPEITAIGTEFTKSTGGTIPLTEITLANLIKNFNANMSRRVVIKGVKVTDGIASGDRNGKISQGDAEMALYDQSKSVVLAADAEGDLIAYPCIRIANGTTTLQLSVWQTSDFTPAGAVVTTISAVDKTVQVGKTVNAEVTTNSPGALSYSSENSQIASVDNQGVITGVAEGETNITVTVAASGDYEEKSATFKVTVTAPVVELPTTVAGIVAQIPDTATGSNTAVEYEADLTGAVVSYVNGNSAYIEDESGAILLYKSGHGFQAGDVISGKVSGKGYKFNGLPEITSITMETPKTTGGTIPLTEMTLADLLVQTTFEANMSRRVIIKGVKVTDPIGSNDRNGKISQGQNEMALYDQSKNVVLAADAEGDLIAYPCIRIANGTTTLQLSVWQTADFITGGAPETTLTAEDVTVQVGETVNASVQTNSQGALSYESENVQIATVDNQGVITGVAEGETNITVTVAASGNYASKSVSFKVTVTATPVVLPSTVKEISDLIVSGQTSVEANLTGAVVSYENGKNAYLEDASGAILVFMNNHGLKAGETVSGHMTVTGTVYKNLPEITALSGEYTHVAGGTIPETEITIADLLENYSANMSRRVLIKGVTVTDAIAGSDRKGEISQNGSKIALYAQNTNCNIAADAQGDIVAYVSIFNSDKQLAIYASDQFTEAGGPAQETTLTAVDKTVEVGKTVNAEVQTNSPGALSYESENVQIATVDNQGVITGVAEGETNITVTVAASGNYASKSVSFKVTVTATPVVLPSTVKEISDLIVSGQTSVEANLTGAVVSYENGKNAYLEDASGAILVFMNNHGLKAGETVSGHMTVTGTVYKNLPEITALSGEYTHVAGGTIPETEITIADLLENYSANMSRRVLIKGVTVTDAIAGSDRKGEISQNGSKIALYAQNTNCNIAADAQGDIVAYVSIFNSDKQLAIYASDQFTEAGGPAQETTLTAVDKTVEVGKTVNAEVRTNSPGALSYESENVQIATVDNQGVITGMAAGQTNITVTVAATSEFAEKSVSFKVTVTEPAQPGGNDGSLEHPYTASEAAALARSGDEGTYYIYGTVTKVAYQFNTGGTASVWLDENGQSQSLFEGFKLKYIGNVSWVTGNALLAVGDELVINGPLTLYTNTNTGAQTPETNGGHIVSWNGKTKALSVPTVTPTPDNDNKQIAVAWTGATGTDAAVSYVVKCGTQSIDATAAGRHVFTMDAYGTYEISVEASASDAIGSKATASATLSDPTPPSGGSSTDTYTFTSKSWGDSTNSWTSGKDGNQLTSGRGVQVTAAFTGANATTKSSFTNVSKVVVTYSTNASKGAGSVAIQVGSNTAHSLDVTKTGGTADRELSYTISPSETGAVKITVTCTENSIYIKSIAITHE